MDNGNVAWVAGGGSGIGLAIAESLSAVGWNVAITGRTEERLASVAQRSPRLLPVRCDHTKSKDVINAFRTINERLGAVSLLVYSAGISPFDDFTDTTVEAFDDVIAINLKGAFLAVKTVLPSMYAAGSGTIIPILSIASVKAFRGGSAYIASKFALKGFTDSLREEARAKGVRVISILPGATETELWDEDERAKFHERMMQPEDVASAVIAAIEMPERAVVEEIRIRPKLGDL